VLTREFKRLQPDVVLFHNEFSPWGAAVVWSGQRLNIPTIAHQHYAVADDPKRGPYSEAKRWSGLLPAGLLCISEHQVNRWAKLPIPVAIGGSRRGVWNAKLHDKLAVQGREGVLFVPGLGDSHDLENVISEYPELQFHIRPHPSSKLKWNLPNVVVHLDNLVTLLVDFEIVVTSSPTPILTLTSLQKPYIRVTSYERVGTCQCSESTSFSSYRELVELLAKGVPATEMASRGCHHNLVRELSRVEYEKSIQTILEGAGV
jgi:hypothetical protein